MGTFSEYVANSTLNAIARATAYSEAAVYVKLHTGDPGATGANNAAALTTRQQATFGTGAGSRAISNTVAVEWTSITTAETYTYISLWNHATTAGTANHLGNDDLSSAAAVSTGDTFRIPIGDLDLTIT